MRSLRQGCAWSRVTTYCMSATGKAMASGRTVLGAGPGENEDEVNVGAGSTSMRGAKPAHGCLQGKRRRQRRHLSQNSEARRSSRLALCTKRSDSTSLHRFGPPLHTIVQSATDAPTSIDLRLRHTPSLLINSATTQPASIAMAGAGPKAGAHPVHIHAVRNGCLDQSLRR